MPFTSSVQTIVKAKRKPAPPKEKRIFEKYKAQSLNKLNISLGEAIGRYEQKLIATKENPLECEGSDGVKYPIEGATNSLNWTIDALGETVDDDELKVKLTAGQKAVPLLGQGTAFEYVKGSDLVSYMKELIEYVEGLTKDSADGKVYHDIAIEMAKPKTGAAANYKYDSEKDEYVK